MYAVVRQLAAGVVAEPAEFVITAVGRNNWVFFGSDEGGKTAAVLRSFVASCQRVGVDPFVWLKDILSRIADHPITRIAELLPHNWVSTQA